MPKVYFVDNIVINHGEPLEVSMPVIYDSIPIAQVLFRSYVCDFDFSFDYKELRLYDTHVTDYIEKWQAFDYDLIDSNFEEKHGILSSMYKVTPMHASRCVVELTDSDLDQVHHMLDVEDPIEQLIYEKLCHCLPITFIFEKL